VRIDALEKWVRRAGVLGIVVFLVMIYQGLYRASRHAKGRASGPAPQATQRTAALYVPLGVVALGLLGFLWRPIRLSLSVPARAVLLAVGAILYFVGLAVMLWGRLALSDMYNLSTSAGAQLYADHRLVTSGPFAVVRHPMYVGGQMAEMGALLMFRTWAILAVAANIPILFLRAKREEEALAAEFGDQWAEYRQRVPFWVPRLPKG